MHKVVFILILLNFFCFAGFSENFDFNITSEHARCHGGSSGKIDISILSGSPEFTLMLYNKKPSSRQKWLVKVSTENAVYTFDNLPAGKYYVAIEDSEGSHIEKEISVDEPEKLQADPITVERCFTTTEMNDAVLKANCRGGTEPYTYLWSENAGNQTSQLAENISPGIYRCFINDKNDCGTVSSTIFFDKKFFKECFPDSE